MRWRLTYVPSSFNFLIGIFVLKEMSSDLCNSSQLDWTLSFHNQSLQREFFHCMRSKRTSNLTLLISSFISLFLFLPFNILILANKSTHQEDLIIPVMSCLMIITSIIVGFCGVILYFCGLYGDFPPFKRFYNVIPNLQTVFIVVVNAKNVLSAYHLAAEADVCAEFWLMSDWYCLGNDEDASFFSLFNIVSLTPLILLIALQDTRAHLIGFCGFLSYLSVVTLALLKGSKNFAVQLTIWSIVIMIIFVDVHLTRVEKFLEALEDIERLQAADRETELRQ